MRVFNIPEENVRTSCTLPLDPPLFIGPHYCFCYRAISQILITAVSFVIDCKEQKLPQTAQINQLLQLLNPICVYGDA